jgi:cell division protein FtsQ
MPPAVAAQAEGDEPSEVIDLTGPIAADPDPGLVAQGTEVEPPRLTRADPAQRRKLMPWVIVAGLGLILSVGAVGASYTPLFDAKHVTVSGTHHLSEAGVLQISGLGRGTNLLHADLGAAELRLERDPWVADATVSRHLPNALAVSIVERVPVATVSDGTGGALLLASDGERLGAVAGNAGGYPAVTTNDAASTPPPQVAVEGGAVSGAMTQSVRVQVTEIIIGADRSIQLQTSSGVTVTYGDDQDLVAKAQDLKAVLDYGVAKGISFSAIDVSVPGAPTARRAGVVAAGSGPVSIPTQ